MLREGNRKSCQSKLVQKVLAVMLHSKHTVNLLGTSALQVAELMANRSSNTLSPLSQELSIS